MRFTLFLVAFLLAACGSAFAQSGFVKSGGQPIPGATVTLTQGDKTISTVTDGDGHYAFPPLSPAAWTASVEMFGFETLKKDVDYGSNKTQVNFDLQLKPSPILQRLQQFARAANRAGTDNTQQVDQQLENELNSQQQSGPAAPTNESTNEAFLVAGSLSPGMTQGSQADSGPDMRFMGQGPGNFGPGETEGSPNAPGFGGPGGPEGGAGAQGPGGGGFGGRGRRRIWRPGL